MNRHGSAAAVSAAGSGHVSGPLPLVGRTRELAALESMIEAGGDSPSVVIVTGEGGVGKSRLAAEIAARANGRGWAVASGRAYPVETGVPYALFSDAFLPTLTALDADSLTVLSRGGNAELRQLFPALGVGTEGHPGIAGSDPEELRTRLMWNFAEFLKAFSTRTPLLVILEDLQWADDSSLHLLHFLARQAGGSDLFFLCTYNDAERDRSPQLVKTERSLLSLGVGEVLRIVPLSREQVTELISRTLAVDPGLVREFSALLFGWTRGNPFFIEEIVKSLVASGRLTSEKGTWVGWDDGDFQLPGSIRDAVLGRIGSFSDDAQTVAELAAVIGARASYPLLVSISGLPEDRLLKALEELCANQILQERAEPKAVVYDFSHPLVQQTLYGEFGLQRARVLHGAVAEAMEVFYGDSAMEHADELASHFARTDATHLRPKAARYLGAAGKAALDRHANREATNYLTAAMERVGGPGYDGPTAADLLPDLARAHVHVGEFESAVTLLCRALEHVPDDDARRPTFRRWLGMAQFWCGRHAEALGQFDAGLASAQEHGLDREVVRLRLAIGHCLQQLGRGEDARACVHAALPVAEQFGDTTLLARVHRSLALIHLWIGPPGVTRLHGERAIELAQEVGDEGIEFWARWGLALLAGMAGDTAGMGKGIEAANRLATELRSPVLRLWTAEMGIELAYGQGDWDAGIAVGEQAIALARSLHQRTLLPRLLVWSSLLHVGRGDVEKARAMVHEAAVISGLDRDDGEVDVHLVVPVYIGQAHYFVAVGDYGDAIAAAEKGLRIAEGTGYTLWAVHRLLPILAEACLWSGDIDRAEEVGNRMRAHANQLDHKLGLGWADACDALVKWKRGDPAGAVHLMRRSAEALEAIPMIPYAARIRRQLAGRLAEIGEVDAALEELRKAHDTFARLGADLELEKSRMQFRELGQRPPPRGIGEGVAGLTGRELEIARLVARRKSNKAIGKELGISPRTASTHLSNIFQKLGVGSRGELADLMRDEGLLSG